MKTTAAGVYLRVSTDRQDEANQEPACLAICASRGWTPQIYRECESALGARPEWARLLEDARTGRIGAVVIYSITRTGRRRTQIASDLADLARWGSALVSVREPFLDTDGSPAQAAVRNLLIQVFGWFAEQERDEIVDRTTRALAKIKGHIDEHGAYTSPRTGRTIRNVGRPAYPAQWQARAKELAAFGLSLRVIAKEIVKEGGPHINSGTIHIWVNGRDGKKAA